MNPEEEKNGSGDQHNRERLNSKKVRVTDTSSPNVGMSSQIIDYYNRFGHNRDLEKYLALTASPISLIHNNNALSPHGSMRMFDSTISARPTITAPDRMEVCRLAVNCSSEDSSSLKETDALDDIPESKEDNIKDDEKNSQAVQPDSDCAAEQNLDTSLTKPVSPSSSITSRRLEWDSLADVGYNDNGGRTLSTLERMALHQQYANSGELQKAEDREMGLPAAQSTPINLILPSTLVQGKSKTCNNKDSRLKKNMKKTVKINQPIVNETIQENFINDQIPGTINVNLTKNVSVNFGRQESLKEVSKKDTKSNALQLRNISTNTSVLTNLDKEIQTTLTRETPKTEQNLKDTNESQIKPLDKNRKDIKYIPIMLKLAKKSQHISVATRHLKRKKFKQKYKKATDLQKLNESKISIDDTDVNIKPSTSQQIREDENQLSEAESFEYLPGHMYQRKESCSKESPDKPMISTSRTTSLESSVGVTSSSQRTDPQDSERSFSKDLRTSIALLNKLVEERHKDASLKRRLIKSVIKKLLKTKYRDDVSTPDEPSRNLADNSECEKNIIVSNDENKGVSPSARDTSEENELLQQKNPNLKKSILRKREFDLKNSASPAHSAPDLGRRRGFYNTKEIARSSLSLELEKLLSQSTYRSDASSKSSSEIKEDSNSVHNSSDDKTPPDWLKAVTKSEKLYEQKTKEKLLKQQIDSFSKSTQSAVAIGDDKSCWVPYDTVLYENEKSEDVATKLVKELSRLPKEIGSGDSRLDSIKSPVGIGNAPRRMHTVFTLAGLNYHEKKNEIPSSSGHKKGHGTYSADGDIRSSNRQKLDKEKKQEPSSGKGGKKHYCCCPHDETSNIENNNYSLKTSCDCCKNRKCALEETDPEEFQHRILTDPKRPLHICDAEGKIIANFNDDFIIYKRVTEPRISDRSKKNNSYNTTEEIVQRQESPNVMNKESDDKLGISGEITQSDLEAEKVSFDYMNKINEIYDIKPRNSSDDVYFSTDFKSTNKIHKEKHIEKSGKSVSQTLTPRMESQNKVAVSVSPGKPSSRRSTRDRSTRRSDRNKKRNDSHHGEQKYDDEEIERNDRGIMRDKVVETGNNNLDKCFMDTKEIQTRLSINTKALKPTLQDINIDDNGPPCQCIGSTCCAAITVSAQKPKEVKDCRENEIVGENSRSHSSTVSEPKIIPQLKEMPAIKDRDKKTSNSKASTRNTDKYDEVITTQTNSLRPKHKSPTGEVTSDERKKAMPNENPGKYDENVDTRKSSGKKTEIGSPQTEMLRSRNEIIADVHTMRSHLHRMVQHKCDCSKYKNVCEKCVPETCSVEYNTQQCHTKKTNHSESSGSRPKYDKSVSTKSGKASSRSIYSPVRSDRRGQQDRLSDIYNQYSERYPKKTERIYVHSDRNFKHDEDPPSPSYDYNFQINKKKENFTETRPKSQNSQRDHNSTSRRTSNSKSGVEYTLSSTSSMTIDSRSVRRPDFNQHNYKEDVRMKIVNRENTIPKSPNKIDKKTYTEKSDYTMTTHNVGTQSVDVESNRKEKPATNWSQNKPDVGKESKRIGTSEHYTNAVRSDRDEVKSHQDGDNNNQELSVSSSLSYTDSLRNLIEMFKDNEKKLEGGQSHKNTPREKQNDILRQLKFLLSATTVEAGKKKHAPQRSKRDNANLHSIDTQTARKYNRQDAANEYRMYETGRSRMYHVHQASVRKDSTETTSENVESPTTLHAQKLFHKFKKAYDKLYSQHIHCCHVCCKFMQQIHNKGDSCKEGHQENKSKSCGKCGTRYAKIYHDTDSSTPVCCTHKCLNRRPGRRMTKHTKSGIAYNLIIEPSSHSIDENVIRKKKTPLKDVFMKIPKSNFQCYNQMSDKEMRRCVSNENLQATEDHIIPGNVYSYPTTSRDGIVSSERRSSAPESSTSEPVYNTMSLREYLHRNRPDFVANADKRQDNMKALHGLRLRHDAAKRLLVSLGAATRSDARQMSLTDVREIASHAGVAIPQNFAGLEKPIKEKEMKQHSQKIFKQLPEQLQKKEKRKREMVRQTNRLMASLYKKSLQKKALQGTVTMSHYTSIVSL